GCLHRAFTGVFLAYILDHHQLCRDVFVALARLFPDGSQILRTSLAVLFRIRQIMHDALALEMLGQRFSASVVLLRSCLACLWLGIVIGSFGPSVGFDSSAACRASQAAAN